VRPRAKWPIRKKLKTGGCALLALVNLSLIAGSLYAVRRLDEAAVLVPNLPDVMRSLTTRPSQIVSRDGKVLEEVVTEFREHVLFDQIPPKVVYATLAAEDKRFYDHMGVDPFGMGRALVTTLSGRRMEGGSTITMQIAKRVYTSSAVSIDRKIQDIALATMIERQLTKDQILELYLNQVYFGAGAYGVSAAAEVYFGKSLDKLTWAEAALLARIVRRPSDENPFVNLKRAVENRDLVLGIIREEGWMSEAEYREALAEEVKLRADRPRAISGKRLAPYVVDAARSWIRHRYPEIDLSAGGYRVELTINTEMQAFAEKAVQQMVQQHRRLRITTAAFVIMDNTGRILAMVGGPDYNKNQFNVVTQGLRQPGSAFKPFIYAAAFEYGALSPYGSVSNEPFLIRDRGTQRYIRGGGKGGSVSVTTALAKSINVPAMWAQRAAGTENVIAVCKNSFGFTSRLDPVQTLALGAEEVYPIEMASAYSVFQSGGDRVSPFLVSKIIGPDGLPIYQAEPVYHRRVLSSMAAEGIDRALRAVVTSGTGTRAGRALNARGKTGTTSDNKDAWFCGYTDRFVAVGWVANEVKTPSGRTRYEKMDDSVMGGQVVAPLWAEIVSYAQKLFGEKPRVVSRGSVDADGEREAPTTPPENVKPPNDRNPGANMGDDASFPEVVPPLEPAPAETENLVTVEVCVDTGRRATAYCPSRIKRAFTKGQEPKAECTAHRQG
jgi:penicillin-binding protein 1A